MIIKQLNLDHFGKFHGREIDLNPGVNIIYGANESGKSTVHAFIQSMLFGAERLRGRACLIRSNMHIPNISRGKAEQAMKDECA